MLFLIPPVRSARKPLPPVVSADLGRRFCRTACQTQRSARHSGKESSAPPSDSTGARLTPPRSPSAPHQFFIPMQIDGCGAGSSVLPGPSSLCDRGQTWTALGCSDVDPSTAQTAQHAQSDLPSLLRGESASWANGRIRSLSQSFDDGGGPVAFPLDPLPPGRKEEIPPGGGIPLFPLAR